MKTYRVTVIAEMTVVAPDPKTAATWCDAALHNVPVTGVMYRVEASSDDN